MPMFADEDFIDDTVEPMFEEISAVDDTLEPLFKKKTGVKVEGEVTVTTREKNLFEQHLTVRAIRRPPSEEYNRRCKEYNQELEARK